jgi:hypothetical protein
VARRTWQFVKLGRLFPGSGWPAARQLNRLCGLSPLNGWNEKFGSFDANVTFPEASACACAGDVPESQLLVGDQPAAVDGVPSHCSTLTSAPGVYPLPTIVNGCGLPWASPGTMTGDVFGVVIVPANATPAATSSTPHSNTMARLDTRSPRRMCLFLHDAAPAHKAKRSTSFVIRLSFIFKCSVFADTQGGRGVEPRPPWDHSVVYVGHRGFRPTL